MQLEYYFGDANLPKDQYLRTQMDPEGWVKAEVLQTFARMKRYGIPADVILRAARQSSQLSVKGNCVRRAVGWERYAPRIEDYVPPSPTDEEPASATQSDAHSNDVADSAPEPEEPQERPKSRTDSDAVFDKAPVGAGDQDEKSPPRSPVEEAVS